MKRLIVPVLAVGFVTMLSDAASAGVLRKLFHGHDCCDSCEPACAPACAPCRVACHEPACDPCDSCGRQHVLGKVKNWVQRKLHHDGCCEPCGDAGPAGPMIYQSAPSAQGSLIYESAPSSPRSESIPAPGRLEPVPAPRVIETTPMPEMGYYGEPPSGRRTILQSARRLFRR